MTDRVSYSGLRMKNIYGKGSEPHSIVNGALSGRIRYPDTFAPDH